MIAIVGPTCKRVRLLNFNFSFAGSEVIATVYIA